MGFIMTLSYLYHFILLVFAYSYWLSPFSMLSFSSCKVCYVHLCFDTQGLILYPKPAFASLYCDYTGMSHNEQLRV